MSKSQARRKRAAQVRHNHGAQLSSQIAFVQNMLLELQWAFQYHIGAPAERTQNAAADASSQPLLPVDIVHDAVRAGLSGFAGVLEPLVQQLVPRVRSQAMESSGKPEGKTPQEPASSSKPWRKTAQEPASSK